MLTALLGVKVIMVFSRCRLGRNESFGPMAMRKLSEFLPPKCIRYSMKIIKPRNNSAMRNNIKGQVSEIPVVLIQIEKRPYAKQISR